MYEENSWRGMFWLLYWGVIAFDPHCDVGAGSKLQGF